MNQASDEVVTQLRNKIIKGAWSHQELLTAQAIVDEVRCASIDPDKHASQRPTMIDVDVAFITVLQQLDPEESTFHSVVRMQDLAYGFADDLVRSTYPVELLARIDRSNDTVLLHERRNNLTEAFAAYVGTIRDRFDWESNDAGEVADYAEAREILDALCEHRLSGEPPIVLAQSVRLALTELLERTAPIAIMSDEGDTPVLNLEALHELRDRGIEIGLSLPEREMHVDAAMHCVSKFVGHRSVVASDCALPEDVIMLHVHVAPTHISFDEHNAFDENVKVFTDGLAAYLIAKMERSTLAEFHESTLQAINELVASVRKAAEKAPSHEPNCDLPVRITTDVVTALSPDVLHKYTEIVLHKRGATLDVEMHAPDADRGRDAWSNAYELAAFMNRLHKITHKDSPTVTARVAPSREKLAELIGLPPERFLATNRVGIRAPQVTDNYEVDLTELKEALRRAIPGNEAPGAVVGSRLRTSMRPPKSATNETCRGSWRLPPALNDCEFSVYVPDVSVELPGGLNSTAATQRLLRIERAIDGRVGSLLEQNGDELYGSFWVIERDACGDAKLRLSGASAHYYAQRMLDHFNPPDLRGAVDFGDGIV